MSYDGLGADNRFLPCGSAVADTRVYLLDGRI